MISVTLLKTGKYTWFHLSFFQMVAEWRDFTVVTKLIKNLKSLYGFGGRCFNSRDVCMDFEPCFKVYNLVSIRPKSMKLSQMTNLNVIFHMVGSVYRLVTIRNSPQFPVEFRNGLCFCFGSEAVNTSGEAVRGLVKSRFKIWKLTNWRQFFMRLSCYWS